MQGDAAPPINPPPPGAQALAGGDRSRSEAAQGQRSLQPSDEVRRSERRAQVVALRTRLLIENRALERRRDLLGERDHATAAKVWLDGPLDHTWLADLMLRVSEANQLGLLGFGGDRGSYHLLAEGSAGVLVTDRVILGAEFRQKPSNLSAFREDDLGDVFLAYFLARYLAITAAFADLGNIADKPGQRGYYISLQGSW